MSEVADNSPAGPKGKQQKKVTILAGLLFLPVFFDSSGIYNSSGLDARGLPISLLIVLFFPFAAFMCRSAKALVLLVVVTICVFLPTAFFGIIYSQYFSLTLATSYLSSIFIGFSAYSLIKRFEPSATPERILLVGAYVIGIVTLFWLPYQIGNILSTGRATGSVLGVFSIYQVWVYWPTALAIAFCASFLSSSPIILILRVFIFLGVFFTGAREPLLFIFVFGFIFLLAKRRAAYFFMFLALGVILGGVMSKFFEIYPDAVISLKVARMMSGEADLSAGRLGVLAQFKLSAVNFFWGTGYSMDGVFGSPHNQYIEFYYRGGIFGLIIAAILVYFWLRSYGNGSTLVWSIFGAVLFSSNMVNTPIRVPYTGAIIWTLFFFLLDVTRNRIDGNIHKKTVDPPLPRIS